jgi:hypothetical protein
MYPAVAPGARILQWQSPSSTMNRNCPRICIWLTK